MTTTARFITVTLPNGEIVKRKTARTYTHAVVVEVHKPDGTITYRKPEWAGRLELAQKNAVKLDKSEANFMAQQHKLPEGWGRITGYQVHIIPVNA